jgi:hypothetical protein
MDVSALIDAAAAQMPDNKSYRRVVLAYHKRATLFQWLNEDGSTFPISERHLRAYIASFKDRILAGKFSQGSLYQYLSGLRSFHAAMGWSWKDIRHGENARQDMSVIRSCAKPKPSTQAPEVEATTMSYLSEAIDANDYDEATFFCIACCLWAGLGRIYELVYSRSDFDRKEQLRGGNLHRLPTGGFHLLLNHPKVKSPLPQSLVLVPLAERYCPARAIESLLAVRPTHHDQALWTLKDGTIADRAWFTGMCQRFIAHRVDDSSFRAGGATHMVLNGIKPELVRKLGRWSSEAFDLYIRSRPSMLAACLQQQLSVTRAQSIQADDHANALAASIFQLGDCLTRLAIAWESTADGQSPAGHATARSNNI